MGAALLSGRLGPSRDDTAAPHGRLGRTVFVGLLSLGCLAWAVWAVSLAFQPSGTPLDFGIYVRCTEHFFSVDSPFGGERFQGCLYPVGFYHGFQAIADAGAAGLTVWALLIAASTLFCFWSPLLIFDLPDPPARTAVWAGLAYAMFLVSEPALESVRTLNASALVAAMVLMALILLVRRSRWTGLAGGILIGAAAVIKLYPLLVALYLLVVGVVRKRKCSVVAGVTAIVLFGVAQLAQGSGDFWRFAFAGDGLVDVGRGGSSNSLTSLLNLLGLRPPLAPIVVVVGGALGLRILARPRPLAVEYTHILLALLLISSVTWSHHYLVAIPALAVALLHAAAQVGVATDAEVSPTDWGVVGEENRRVRPE